MNTFHVFYFTYKPTENNYVERVMKDKGKIIHKKYYKLNPITSKITEDSRLKYLYHKLGL